ncbi:hypothetical protein GCM10010376_04700 [Streptomyces violaceusniger]
MAAARRASVWAKVQRSREAFCCISSAEVATPPALAALPGPKSTSASRKISIAAGVQGMLAPSVTASTPFLTRAIALCSVSSSWVAQGSATSQGSSKTEPRPEKTAPGLASA